MKKYKIVNKQAIKCILLSLLGITNNLALAWMATKTKEKNLSYLSFLLLIGAIISLILGNYGIISVYLMSSLVTICAISPTILLLLYLSEFKRRMNMILLVKEYHISVEHLNEKVNEKFLSELPKEWLKSSEKLYPGKGAAVLYAVASCENIECKQISDGRYKEQTVDSTFESCIESQKTTLKKKIDINICDENELSQVPGIGLILAKKAMDVRRKQGRFNSVEEFMYLVGIKQDRFNSVSSFLICDVSYTQSENPQNRTQGRKVDL